MYIIPRLPLQGLGRALPTSITAPPENTLVMKLEMGTVNTLSCAHALQRRP